MTSSTRLAPGVAIGHIANQRRHLDLALQTLGDLHCHEPDRQRPATPPSSHHPRSAPGPGRPHTPRQLLKWLITAVDAGTPLSTAIADFDLTPAQTEAWLADHPDLADQLKATCDRWYARRSVPLTPRLAQAVNSWRRGERTAETRRAHNADTRAWRRQQAAAQLPPARQRHILSQLAAGRPLRAVADDAGLTTQAMFGRAQWDSDWRRRLDQALMDGRDPDLDHGTTTTYRHHGCRCPKCRIAKK
ncbi:hypothetical protein GCM10010411_74180 [Actinomadura fulvescens]|uniref:Uncharacterized protein n=1 Tax=Actinomadura fulvescens TaxID=46160 RepID=A0ABN3QH61_9ACTN